MECALVCSDLSGDVGALRVNLKMCPVIEKHTVLSSHRWVPPVLMSGDFNNYFCKMMGCETRATKSSNMKTRGHQNIFAQCFRPFSYPGMRYRSTMPPTVVRCAPLGDCFRKPITNSKQVRIFFPREGLTNQIYHPLLRG